MTEITKMSDRELASTIDEAESDGLTNSGEFLADQEQYLKYYQALPFGDEVEGRSQVVSTDVRDLVEADTPSLARTFLGAGDPVEFQSNTRNPVAIQEAKDMQLLVSHIIETIPDSFRILHGWLKSTEIQDLAALEYGIDEVETVRYKAYRGQSPEDMAVTIQSIEDDPSVTKVKVVEQDEESGTITIRITHKRNEPFIRNVSVEDLIISKNAQTKNQATVIGKRFLKTRGELVSEGFSKALIDSLPTHKTKSDSNTSGMKQARYRQQGGDDVDNSRGWANQEIKGEDVYIKVDYDGDGIAERRHVIKVGTEILVNEPFDHVPYAISSSMLMPDNLVGISRAQLVMQYQKINSVLWRQTLDNMYSTNNPRHVISDDVDEDEFLDIQFNGVVHTDGKVSEAAFPLVVPYIGDKSLQVIQYMEGKKAASAGQLVNNQALEADQLSDETATRFKGMENAAAAKIELVARVIAETGYRDLWEGMAWFATHYQDTKLEMRILGREMAFDPTEWRYDMAVVAKVGTGAGDDEKSMTNLSGIFAAQTQLMTEGSKLTDDGKRYNTLTEMVRVIGRHDPGQFFNNPEQPESMLMAERDMLKKMVQQFEAQAQGQNQLADAARVEAEGKIAQEQLKQKFQSQIKVMEMQQAFDDKLRTAMAEKDKELSDLQFKYTELAANTKFKYTELEVKNSTDVEGEGQGE